MFALTAMPVLAEWVQTGPAEAGMTQFHDPASVRAAGDIRNVLRLASQAKTGQSDAMSNRASWEFDCRRAQGRIVEMLWFQEPMGLGLSLDVTYRTAPDWRPVAPGTLAQSASIAMFSVITLWPVAAARPHEPTRGPMASPSMARL